MWMLKQQIQWCYRIWRNIFEWSEYYDGSLLWEFFDLVNGSSIVYLRDVWLLGVCFDWTHEAINEVYCWSKWEHLPRKQIDKILLKKRLLDRWRPILILKHDFNTIIQRQILIYILISVN